MKTRWQYAELRAENVSSVRSVRGKEIQSLSAGSLRYDVSFGDEHRICFISAIHHSHIFCDNCVENTFPPHARRSNTTKYLSWGFFWTSSSCSKVTTQSDLQNCYSYFSYNPSRAQKAPHSCFEASKEHSCISSVSALPATVYVASGVCRGRQ